VGADRLDGHRRRPHPHVLWDVGTAGDGRPVTHSLAFVLVLIAVGLLVPRLRIAVGGLGVGLLLHLVRDLATGPGAPLLWPVHDSSGRRSAPAEGEGQSPLRPSRTGSAREKRAQLQSPQSVPLR
jgi:hypothetical protein